MYRYRLRTKKIHAVVSSLEEKDTLYVTGACLLKCLSKHGNILDQVTRRVGLPYECVTREDICFFFLEEFKIDLKLRVHSLDSRDFFFKRKEWMINALWSILCYTRRHCWSRYDFMMNLSVLLCMCFVSL